MKLFKHVILLTMNTLIVAKGYCDESETDISSDEEASPSIYEVIVDIANDPGASLGGDR